MESTRDDNSAMKQQQDEEQQFLLQRRAEMTEKLKSQISPVGEAKWAHLHTPKAAFVDEHGKVKGEPKYQVDVCFPKDDAIWLAWAADVMALIKALPVQVDKHTGEVLKKQTPIKRELDESEQPTGRFYVTFRTSDKFKPVLFDKFGVTIPESILIGNGSKVRISYSSNIYTAFGGGVNFYLNAVQVIDLVEYQSRNAEGYGFGIEALPASAGTPDDPFADFDNNLPF